LFQSTRPQGRIISQSAESFGARAFCTWYFPEPKPKINSA
jgi:hypothetical protein